MADRALFTEAPRSKHSKAGRLWRWFIRTTGTEPRYLVVIRPGYWQEKAGAARYAITDRDNNEFLIFDVESALKSKPIANWEHRAHPLGNQYYVGDL